jgi:hypothetical protein
MSDAPLAIDNGDEFLEEEIKATGVQILAAKHCNY